jgi:predicted HD phosphohydrolase
LSKLEGTPTLDGRDDQHEHIASQYLKAIFPESIYQPIALHVKAKRYLVSTDALYFDTLSMDSVRSLRLQGGLMTSDECHEFTQTPFHQDAIQLRYWDDLGKRADIKLPAKEIVIGELNDLIEVCL